MARCDPPDVRALSQALYETLEASERLLGDVKEVLNLNRVCAAGCIYNAMREAQGEVAEAGGSLLCRLFRRGGSSTLSMLTADRSAAETPLLYGTEALEFVGAWEWWQ